MISTFWKHAVEITTRLDFKWYHSQNTGQVYYQTSVVLDIPSKESAAALGHHGISRVIQVLAWCIPSLWAGRRARPAWPVAGGKSPIEILRDFVCLESLGSLLVWGQASGMCVQVPVYLWSPSGRG